MKRNQIVTGAIIIVIVVFFAVLFIAGTAKACEALVGTATTDVYVRDIGTGDVVGSLYKNDKVVVLKQKSNGWDAVMINDKKYIVYGKYLSVESCCLDEVTVVTKVRKSKSMSGNPIKNKKACPIKGSIFEDIGDLW